MMIIIRTVNTPAHIRGYLRRFLSEPVGNMFVGKVSRRVSDSIWERVTESEEEFSAVMICSSSVSEQGFVFLSHNMSEGFYVDENEEITLFGRWSP